MLSARTGVFRVRGMAALIMLVVLVLMLTTAAGAATDVGTLDNPVRLSVEASDGDPGLLEAALEAATGLEFEFEDAGIWADAVEWMCVDYPDSSVRIMGSVEYVFADQDCGADARLHVFRFGSDSYWTGFFVPDDSEFYTLDDLVGVEGLEWYHPSIYSISGYMVPKGMLAMAGIEYSEIDVDDHVNVVSEIYLSWDTGDPVFGTAYWDARTNPTIVETYPDVEDKVRKLAQSPDIPNSPVAFGPHFPAKLRRQIEQALVALADPEGPDYATWETSLWEDSSLDRLKVKEFKFLKSAIEAAGIDIGDL